LFSLDDNNWLTGSIVDSYFKILSLDIPLSIFSFSNFLFSSYTNTRSFNLKNATIQKLSKYDLILIPICFGNHWRILIFDFTKTQLIIYDSLSLCDDLFEKILSGFLDSFFSLLNIRSKWDLTKVTKPKQYNGFDCGVFICLFARYYCYNLKKSFRQDQILKFREHLKIEITESKLSPVSHIDLDLNYNDS
jgi:Ulp1 family protease